jgi:hypothetical protein
MSKTLTVSPNKIYVKHTDSAVQLAVTDDTKTVVTGAVSYSTDNGSVAAVNATGLVTPRGKGKCSIKITSKDGAAATVPVEII